LPEISWPFAKSDQERRVSEWRQVLEARSELPSDRQLLLYCNSGTLSAQAGFALRVAGMDNVRILQGGFQEWQQAGGFEANQRALERTAQ